MTKNEEYLMKLLHYALKDLKEHLDEYHYRGTPGLIEKIEAAIEDSE